ncbi:MAG: nicotinate phosphoribosyltransferase [Spirochaetota bacterium]
MRERLNPEIFNIPVEAIKSGFYTDAYFNRTRSVLLSDGNHSEVVMQVFVRDDGVLCGIDEAISIIRLCSENPERIRIRALYDGDPVSRGETVMLIEGDYSSFAHLETVYLGVLARGTSIATVVRKTVEAAGGKSVLFFGSRFDHYLVQSADGYAALIGGADAVSTDANGYYLGKPGVGTIPHALIAAYGGDTLKACVAFRKHIPSSIDLIALVDFKNDCIGTSLEVARHFGEKLWGVRVDTAGDLRDVSVTGTDESSYGVSQELVFKLREALDREGFGHVRIIISGGFNWKKVRKFVELGVPFDAVGVGSAFYRERIDFTADIVMVNGKPCAKVGRSYKPNPRLEDV